MKTLEKLKKKWECKFEGEPERKAIDIWGKGEVKDFWKDIEDAIQKEIKLIEEKVVGEEQEYHQDLDENTEYTEISSDFVDGYNEKRNEVKQTFKDLNK